MAAYETQAIDGARTVLEGGAIADRLAIQDLLTAYARGVDRVDVGLLKSCYWPEATDDHGTFVGKGHDFCDYLATSLKRFISTTHVLSNMHVELRGGAARSECYFTATHWFPPECRPAKAVLAGRYIDRLERRAGEWRILARMAVADWVELAPEAASFAPIFDKIVHRGKRFPNDPWYAQDRREPEDFP